MRSSLKNILVNVKSVNLILAEIHHLILNQNRLSLLKNLKPDDIISKMLEKDSSMEQYVLSTDNQEEMIQRFIECLQSSRLKDYKHFIQLLYKTQQGSLATNMTRSCEHLLSDVIYIFA